MKTIRTFRRIFVNNTVVYTGTHDNPTSREWFEELSRESADDRVEQIFQ